MLNLLDNIEPADILAFARAVPTPEDFLLTRDIVPETQINNVKYRIRNRLRRISAAKFRAFDAETPRGRREVSHSILEGMLPPLGDSWSVGELETILLEIERGADDDALVEAIYEDTEAHVLAIKARLEIAAGDLLVDGVFELNDENGVTLEADFQVPASFRPAAPIMWSDPTAKILDDERAWVRHLMTVGSGRPGEALTSELVLTHMARNNQVKGEYFGEADGAARPTLTDAQLNEVRRRRGLPPVRTYDTTVRVDGANDVRPLPENRYFLLPANKREFAETQYGITAESIALRRNGNPRIERDQLPGIVVTAWERDNPVSVGTKGAAVAMPVLYDNQAHISAQVLA